MNRPCKMELMGFISLTVFAIYVANVSSKVQIDGVQAETIRLRLRGIQSDKGNEYGLEGESTWYCQRMEGNDGSSSSKPVYFVQPQSKKHKHGGGSVEGQPSVADTTVYILPPKTSHEIDIHTAENGVVIPKPTFFFLKNHPSEHENNNQHGHSQRSVSSVSISATSSSPPIKDYPSVHRNLKRNRTSSHRRGSSKAIL